MLCILLGCERVVLQLDVPMIEWKVGERMSKIDLYNKRKKMIYDFMCEDMYVPMKIKELCIVLGVSKEDRPQLERILLELQEEGKITLSKRGKYAKSC